MNLDAYTIRKIAPRLLLAIIAVNLSIYLCVAAIDISNVVGHGLSQLIRGPFDVGGALNVNLDEGSSNISAFFMLAGGLGALGLASVALSGGAIPMIFMTLLPIILVVIAVIVTIAVRQALLVLLTLVSPVAIACLVLPGTEKYFKQWWDLFLKTLIVYPIIAALFAVSDVMASILLNASNRPKINNIQGASDIIVGMILTVMPLFLIPFAFKFAGGVLGSIINGANQMSQPFIRLARRKRQQGLEAGWQNWKQGKFLRPRGTSGFRYRASQAAAYASNINKAGFGRPRTMHENVMASVRGNKIGQQKAVMEDPRFQEMMKYEQVLRAGSLAKNRKEHIALMKKFEPEFLDPNGLALNADGSFRRKTPEEKRRAGALLEQYASDYEMLKRDHGAAVTNNAAAVHNFGVSTLFKDTWQDEKGNIFDKRDYIDPATGRATIDEPKTMAEANQRGWTRVQSGMQATDYIHTVAGGDAATENYLYVQAALASSQGRNDWFPSASAGVLAQQASSTGVGLEEAQQILINEQGERMSLGQVASGSVHAIKPYGLTIQENILKAHDSLQKAKLTNDPKAEEAAQAKLQSSVAEAVAMKQAGYYGVGKFRSTAEATMNMPVDSKGTTVADLAAASPGAAKTGDEEGRRAFEEFMRQQGMKPPEPSGGGGGLIIPGA